MVRKFADVLRAVADRLAPVEQQPIMVTLDVAEYMAQIEYAVCSELNRIATLN